MINVAIIENNRLVREGLALKLNEQADFTVSYSSADGSMEDLRDAASQVLLLDVGMAAQGSLEHAKLIRSELPGMRVILMDLPPIHGDLFDFVTAGVSGFILKDATLDELLTTIRSVADGQTILPPQMTTTLFTQIAKGVVLRGLRGMREATQLTPRERSVVVLVSDGLSNSAIAKHLGISPHTVKSHVGNIMEKLALHSRLQIAAYLHRPIEAGAED